MPDIEHLRRLAFPEAVELVHGSGSPRDVAWVRVLTPRVPAFDALDEGDLALIPGTALATLASSGVEPATIVSALADARAAGALVVGGVEPSVIEPLRDGARTAGIPLWHSHDDDAAAIERGVIRALVAERATLDRRAADLEAEIGRLALAGADLTAQLAVIAGALSRAVAIEGPRGEAVAVHAPDEPAAAAAAAAYLANRRHVLLRMPLPGPGPGAASSGAFVILGEPPASEFERLVAERIVAMLALELARGSLARTGASRRADALPGDGPPWVALMARQLVAEAPTELEQRERLRERIARLGPARRLRLRGDAGSLELRVIVAASPADPLGLATAGQVADMLGRLIAVSRPFHRPDDRPLAEQEARATLEAVEALPATAAAGLVARADRLAAYRLLGGLHNLPDGLQNARALLAPILAGRPAAVAARLATLRAVLEQPGLAEAARVLGIHRNTLAYRITRLEATSGWRLHEPDLRFALALAVRLVQNAQDET